METPSTSNGNGFSGFGFDPETAASALVSPRETRTAPFETRHPANAFGVREGTSPSSDTALHAIVAGFDRAGKGKTHRARWRTLTGRRRAFVARTGPGVVVFYSFGFAREGIVPVQRPPGKR